MPRPDYYDKNVYVGGSTLANTDKGTSTKKTGAADTGGKDGNATPFSDIVRYMKELAKNTGGNENNGKTGNNSTVVKSSGGGGIAAASPAYPTVTQADLNGSAYAQALAAAQAARGGMPTYEYAGRSAGTAPTYEAARKGGFDTAAPTYAGTYDNQLMDLYGRLTSRGDFSYDLTADPLYQQYRDQYMQQGKMAMTDTMGQAAALTGGYGSSYGQAVGQQAYDRRMEELLDIAPALYDRAYQRYNDEGDRLQQQYSMMRQMANDEYGRYQDEYNRWLTERDYAAQQEAQDYSRYMDEYNRWLTERDYASQQEQQAYNRYMDQYGMWQNERDYADAQAQQAYKQQQDNLDFLVSMIQLGYTPTAQELAEAGITTEQYKALAGAYMPQPVVVRSSGTKDKSGGDKYTNTDEGTAAAAAQEAALAEEYAQAQKMEEELQRWLAAQGRNGQSNRIRG